MLDITINPGYCLVAAGCCISGMTIYMSGSLLFILIITLFAFFFAAIARRQAARRSAIAWVRRKLGEDVLLVSECLLLAGRRGTRGAIGITAERIVWRRIHFSKQTFGEMPLSDVEILMWSDAERGAHPAIKWRVPGMVMTLKSTSQTVMSFLLESRVAPLWEKVLDSQMAEGPPETADSRVGDAVSQEIAVQQIEENLTKNPENHDA